MQNKFAIDLQLVSFQAKLLIFLLINFWLLKYAHWFLDTGSKSQSWTDVSIISSTKIFQPDN